VLRCARHARPARRFAGARLFLGPRVAALTSDDAGGRRRAPGRASAATVAGRRLARYRRVSMQWLLRRGDHPRRAPPEFDRGEARGTGGDDPRFPRQGSRSLAHDRRRRARRAPSDPARTARSTDITHRGPAQASPPRVPRSWPGSRNGWSRAASDAILTGRSRSVPRPCALPAGRHGVSARRCRAYRQQPLEEGKAKSPDPDSIPPARAASGSCRTRDAFVSPASCPVCARHS
jgi:hypothetical protein